MNITKFSMVTTVCVSACIAGMLSAVSHAKEVKPFVPTKAVPKNVPALMQTKDGKKVTSIAAWEDVRRAEIMDTFLTQMYGKRPKAAQKPAFIKFDAAEPDKVMMDGHALRKRIRCTYGGPYGQTNFVFTAFIPTAAKGTPAPAFLLICNRKADENINPDRTKRTGFWPAEEIIARGYAAIAFFNGDIAKDATWDFNNGVFPIFQKKEDRTKESWGILSAWAWGASRVMDWIEKEPLLDAKHVGVVGHSRGGKTALFAGVSDPRFAMACVNDSGCGGAKLNHIDLPKSEHITQIWKAIGCWFCGNFEKYCNREMEMPFDQHQWAALMAPRLLAIASASEDSWAGQEGEFYTAKFASSAWELYGVRGLVGARFPKVGEPLQEGNVSYHMRAGEHNLTPYDWNRYMDFADRHGWRKAAPAAQQNGKRIPLWTKEKMPFAQSHQIAAMTDEVGTPGFNPAENAIPYIEWYDVPAGTPKKDLCMILISGGGYFNCCDVGLVKAWRERFLKLGVTCVNFVYRTPRPKGLPIHTTAWADGQRAVRMVRAAAAEHGFNPDKIGAISMSAGSHLNVLLATSALTPAYAPTDDFIDVLPCHLNCALTCAIAYAVTDGIGIPNSRRGQAIDAKLDSIFKFDAATCPMWMSHGGNDPYSPMASTLVYRQLRRLHIPAEVHLYPDKQHGAFGLERAVEFLRQMGFLGKHAPEEDIMKRFSSDEARATYAKADIWPAAKIPDLQTNQCTPYLEWHLPKKLTTKAIQIIYSGGSYMGNHPEGFEVAPIRRYLNEKGMAVVTLKYRTPRPLAGLAKHTTAWQDLQRCIRLVRKEAPARGLDPKRIGIMGSSAGGHLTLMGATSSRSRSYTPIDKDIDHIPCNVQWAVAIYPAYALTDGAERPNLHGGNEDDARLVPEFAFDPDTCPILFFHGDSDGWAAMNSVKCWEQIRRMGIQGEVHTMALRNHCFMHFAEPETGSYTWLDRIPEFLKTKGFIKNGESL